MSTVVLALLLPATVAAAGNVLRGSAASSGTPSANQAAAAAAQAAAAAAAGPVTNSLRAAMDAIRAWQAAQSAAAARAAATSQPGDVPDGLGAGTGGLDFQSASGIGTPSQTTTPDGHVTVDLVQSAPRAVVTWNTFNVGKKTEVYFDQRAGNSDMRSWAVLNFVQDPQARPSRILGSIVAEGQVYVVNRNGVIFGGTSQVNAGTLVVSGLDLAGGASRFGGPSSSSQPTLYDLSFVGDSSSVTVEAGALLKAAAGRIVLVGNEVRNRGSLQSDDGQVLLVAGGTVGLASSGDLSAVRGLTATVSAPTVGTGTVENAGIISAARGNITLAGANILQNGLLTATTGAEANGSITLSAQGSSVEFGTGSVTQILPDPGGKKVIGTGESYKPSSLQVNASTIDVLDGAVLYVPAGQLTLNASMTAAPPPNTTDPIQLDSSKVYVGVGARLDVSGLADVSVPMEQNSISAQLRASELRDNPVLRNSALRGQTVYFDARLGGKLTDGSGVADLSGYYDLVQRDVSQLMTSGGTVTLNANQIITRPGSLIDLSGGSLSYQAGYVRRTVLLDPSRRLVPIESAVAGVPYVGVAGDSIATHVRWGVTETFQNPLGASAPQFEGGYLQGGSAGTLKLGTAPGWWAALSASDQSQVPNPSAVGAIRVLEGDIAARVTIGPFQRNVPTGSADPTQVWQQRPMEATLAINNAGDVTVGTPAPLGASFGPDSAVDSGRLYQLVLPSGWFNGKTFSSLNIGFGADVKTDLSTNNPSGDPAPGGHFTLPAGAVVNLGDYGSFSFSGRGAEIDGAFLAPGGKVGVTTLNGFGDTQGSPTIHLASSGRIDVAGRLTNDSLDGSSQPYRPVNGGSVSLKGGAILLDAGSVVDASGGARLDAAGAKFTAGNGGSISLDTSAWPNNVNGANQTTQYLGQLVLGGRLDGRAAGLGGSLTVKTGHDVQIGGSLTADQTAAGTVLFTPDFFTQGGFASYTVRGGWNVTVAGATTLAPAASVLLAPQNVSELPTGTLLGDVSTSVSRVGMAGIPPAPMSLSLTATGAPLAGGGSATLELAKGAAIEMVPGSQLTLASNDFVKVNGAIRVPGGSIAVAVTGSNVLGALRIGDPSTGDVGEISARGYSDEAMLKGIPVRSVHPGGSVTLSSPGEVSIAPGSTIDVSGLEAVADLPRGTAAAGRSPYVPVMIDGDAGSLAISAGSGVLGGTLSLHAAGPSGRGGSITIDASGSVVVTQQQPTSSVGGLTVVADTIDASRADDLSIVVAARDRNTSNTFDNTQTLAFAGDVNLRTNRSIVIGSPIVGWIPSAGAGTNPSTSIVKLQSSYVSFEGRPGPSGVQPDVPSQAGSSPAVSLDVHGDVIDVSRMVVLGCPAGGACSVSSFALSGFASTTFKATGDIRLSAHSQSDGDFGQGLLEKSGLLSSGAIELDAAQVYVTSRVVSPGVSSARLSADPGFLVWSGQKISILSNGAPAPVPLSFGERLTMRAPDIEQGGVLRAPQGEIRLEGRDVEGNTTGQVNLLAGSVTSASLAPSDGSAPVVVPFGSVLSGGVFSGYGQPGQSPAKGVRLDAPAVAVAPGALVDVSGGGDLQGYTFVPGNGGSSDVLAARTNASGQIVTDKSGNPLSATSLGTNVPAPFAILPSLGTQPLPVARSADLRDNRLEPGDQVYLQGVPGLRDGYYTLLPAHYALLPGGLLVQPLSGSFATSAPSFTRPDGAIVASGYETHVVRGDSGGARVEGGAFQRFVLMPQDVFLKYSQLATYGFSDAASSLAGGAGVAVRVPNDAGNITIAAQTSLALQGTARMEPGTGGLLGNLDLSLAGQIAVVGPNVQAPAGYLALQASDLSAFGAGSILIGGTRSQSAQGTTISVAASDVRVDTGSVTWTGTEILLAGNRSVLVADGSRVSAAGTAPVDTSPLLLSGDGALLRLSTGTQVPLTRSNVPAQAIGTLTIGNASLSAAGSMSLDAGQTVTLSPALSLTTPQLDLVSNEVHLGAAAPSGATGTWLTSAQLAQLGSASDLVIQAPSAIYLHGSLSLGAGASGAATSGGLTFDTALLQDVGDGNIAVAGSRLTLRNSGSATPTPSSGAGSLRLAVDSLVLGPGEVQVAGFANLAGSAGSTTVAGSGGLTIGGGLTLETGRVAVASGSRYALSSGGSLELDSASGVAAPAALSLGAALTLTAASIVLDTSIVLPAGVLVANATAGSLTIGPHASIDTGGRSVDFFGQSKAAPGGAIRLAASGDLTIAQGAILDVSAAGAGADAGSLEITAGGQADVQGTLRGQGASGSLGGSFALDAGTVPSFSALNALLGGGGFTEAIAVRLRGAGQSIQLGQGESVLAHDVTLRSDQGQVIAAGAIGLDGDASHPAGGIIQLLGEGGVSLAGTARIDARAAASEKDGFSPASGEVLVAAGQAGRVSISGATIDVTGGRSGGGSIVVRAAREGDGVAIDSLSGTFLGAKEQVVQGLATYAATGTPAIDNAWFATPLGDASIWLAAARARYPGGFGGFDLAPAIVVKSGGDMAIAGQLSLSGTDTSGHSIPGGPGYLGFVSGGGIDVTGAVSDGFAGTLRTASLLAGRSYSLSLEAAGNLTIEQGAMLRTGTGDISIATGGSLTFKDSTSVIYTAGQRTDPAAGFLGASGLPAGAVLGEFPTDGGNVALRVGGDIVAPITKQTTSAWLYRYGTSSHPPGWLGDAASLTVAQQTSWSIVYANFEQGVGALGGGDVRVSAAGNVSQLQVSIPTTGQLTSALGNAPAGGDLVVRGGGDLRVQAGGDVVGGLYMLGAGLGDLRAGGSVRPTDQKVGLRSDPSLTSVGSFRPVGALFGLMDAEVRVIAGGDVTIEGAYDPGRQGQLAGNATGNAGSAFVGYTDRTSLSATAVAGTVKYENDPWASLDLTQGSRYAVLQGGSGAGNLSDEFKYAPPTLRLTSLQANAVVEDPLSTAPTLYLGSSPTGTLEVMAGHDVLLKRSIALKDLDPRYVRGPLAPYAATIGAAGNVTIDEVVADPVKTNSLKGFTPIHANDPDPIRLYAVNGSVCAQRTGCVLDNPLNLVSVVAPKPVEAIAGEDIVRGLWQPQNNNASDVSILMAGRDVMQPIVEVTGAGSQLIQAGRDVVLAHGEIARSQVLAGGAIYALGNTVKSSLDVLDPTQGAVVNQALPAGRAADVYVLAGAAPGRVDYDAFAATYLDPANHAGVVHVYLPELRRYLENLDPGKYDGLSDANLLGAFRALPLARRELFLDGVYLKELQETGIDYNDSASPRYRSYNRGFLAVKTLFPVDPGTIPAGEGGDIVLAGKPTETEAQGNIVLLAPYGNVEVGAPLVPSIYVEGLYGGVITRRGGDVQIMAGGNIDLFTSRVFTLEGGDILMWTSDGSITAGFGSKTSVFQKPIAYSMTSDAFLQVNAFGLQTGAGIGVLDALGDAGSRVSSRLDLIAPRGEVNAGDAGIRVVGNLNIAAAVVVGVENIQVSGASSGVPKVEAPNIGSLTTASAVAQAAAKQGVGPESSAAKAAAAAADLPSIITVEVVGYETTDEAQDPKAKKGKKR
jgi:filamentous hemagglutinin family protein